MSWLDRLKRSQPRPGRKSGWNAGREVYRALADALEQLGAPRVLVCDERHQKAAARLAQRMRRAPAAELAATARRGKARQERARARAIKHARKQAARQRRNEEQA